MARDQCAGLASALKHEVPVKYSFSLPLPSLRADGYDSNRLISYMCSSDQPRQFWSYLDEHIETEDAQCLEALGTTTCS